MAKGVKHQAVMSADACTVHGVYLSRCGRQELFQEGAETAFTDKTDTSTVFFIVRHQVVAFCQFADVRFIVFTDREQGMRELVLIQCMQEITLVFIVVEAAQQLRFIVVRPAAGIMSGCDLFCTERLRVIKEGVELDLFIAQDIWIRRAPGPVFIEEVLKYPVPVFAGKVDAML